MWIIQGSFITYLPLGGDLPSRCCWDVTFWPCDVIETSVYCHVVSKEWDLLSFIYLSRCLAFQTDNNVTLQHLPIFTFILFSFFFSQRGFFTREATAQVWESIESAVESPVRGESGQGGAGSGCRSATPFLSFVPGSSSHPGPRTKLITRPSLPASPPLLPSPLLPRLLSLVILSHSLSFHPS